MIRPSFDDEFRLPFPEEVLVNPQVGRKLQNRHAKPLVVPLLVSVLSKFTDSIDRVPVEFVARFPFEGEPFKFAIDPRILPRFFSRNSVICGSRATARTAATAIERAAAIFPFRDMRGSPGVLGRFRIGWRWACYNRRVNETPVLRRRFDF